MDKHGDLETPFTWRSVVPRKVSHIKIGVIKCLLPAGTDRNAIPPVILEAERRSTTSISPYPERSSVWHSIIHVYRSAISRLWYGNAEQF